MSYVLLALVSLLRVKYFKELPDEAIINSGLTLLIGIIMAVIGSFIYNNKYFKKITVYFFHKTPHSDIWRDVLDLEKGSNLKVYLKDKDYYIIGHHKVHEENGDSSWLALNGFAKMDKNTNDYYKNEPRYNNGENEDVIITVRFSDIEHIEIF